MQVQPIAVKMENGAIRTELTLIEFQGTFEHSEAVDGQFTGMELGQINEKAGDSYELTVGNHLLKGKSASDLLTQL